MYNLDFNSVTYGDNKYVAINQFGNVLYSQDGLNWESNYNYIKDYRDINFVNDLFILYNNKYKYENKIAISHNGINFHEIDIDYRIKKIINNGDDLLAIGSSKEDKEFVKRLLYFNKKDNHTFEFQTMYKSFINDICPIKDNKDLVLDDDFIGITSDYGFTWDYIINCKNKIFYKAVYLENQNKCILFEATEGIYSLDLENNKLEKIGYIPDRRYLYDIKYKDGLFVIACKGDKNDFLWYSRDGINYKQANISIDSSNELKHRKTTYNNFIMSLACNNDSFVAVGSNNLILHSYDGINYTICKL